MSVLFEGQQSIFGKAVPRAGFSAVSDLNLLSPGYGQLVTELEGSNSYSVMTSIFVLARDLCRPCSNWLLVIEILCSI